MKGSAVFDACASCYLLHAGTYRMQLLRSAQVSSGKSGVSDFICFRLSHGFCKIEWSATTAAAAADVLWLSKVALKAISSAQKRYRLSASA